VCGVSPHESPKQWRVHYGLKPRVRRWP
jgi:hypothetical protein